MASKRRLRRKICERKMRFNEEKDAISRAKFINKDKGMQARKVIAYKCKFCGKYHIGKPSNKILVSKGKTYDHQQYC